MDWFLIAPNAESLPWQENNLCVVEAGSRKVTLALQAGKLFAFVHKCPHAGGIMADGFLDGSGNVVCPEHRYKFELSRGRNTSGEGYYLKTYPLEQREHGLYVGLEAELTSS